MCGLNLTIDGQFSIREMNEKIAHRGLKGISGSLECDNISFGHVRLPIQGLTEEFKQPYVYKHFIFLFVGEIYNYKQLDSNAKSDIEVLAKFWEKHEIKAFDFFDGMWSVIVYDKHKKELNVITDFLCKKPLYVHIPTCSISSEIKSLCDKHYEYTENQLFFSRVGKWGYCNSNDTFFNEIAKIPPYQHWKWYYNKDTIKFESKTWGKLCGKKIDLKKEIHNSVQNRLIADIPISLLLSGGIDSSIIFKIMVSHTHDFKVFHIANKEEEFLNYLDIPGSISICKLDLPEDMSTFTNDTLYYNESPIDLGSMLSQFCIANKIKEYGLNVSISGDGADELFGGYRRSLDYDSQYSDIFDELVYYHIPRLDKLMMSQTIELRCPFLSKDVIEGSLALPYSERIDKKYLRNLFSDILPSEIYNRKKLPLKSKQVLNDGLQWRYLLMQEFKKIIPKYFEGGY